MSLDSLPTELYEVILFYVPSSDLQLTTLALSRAVPLAGIPLRHLFRSIRITHPQQAILLYKSLRAQKDLPKPEVNPLNSYQENLSVLEQTASWIEEISIEAWDVDAEIIINIFHLLQLPKLYSLTIWIGPRNFAPEHLEELILKPLLSLRYLSLRFRPYVQKATYYQFLKGAYFDSTLTALSRWPPTFLPTLSIVQDPLDSAVAQKQNFAQPLVFFRLDIPSLLRSSALSRTLRSLRLRIPLRPVVRSLCVTPTSFDPSFPKPCPGLQFIDLSTSRVLESEVEMLLVNFTELNHIIVDDCPIFRGDLQEGSWSALGKRLALVGVKRSKEREKALKMWLEASAAGNLHGSSNTTTTRRIRPGRSGLATATISLRSAAEPAVVIPPPRLPVLRQVIETPGEGNGDSTLPLDVKSGNKDKTKGKNKTPEEGNRDSIPPLDMESGDKDKIKRKNKTPGEGNRDSTPPLDVESGDKDKTKGKNKGKGKKSGKGKEAKKKIPPSKIRVLPTLPTLKTLSITLQSITEANRHAMIRSQFEEGWAEGIAQLGVTRGRLRTSGRNGYRIMRTSSDGAKDKDQDSSESGSGSGDTASSSNDSNKDGLFGLEDIDKEDLDAYGMPLDEQGLVYMSAPVLCFGGPRRDRVHVDNCGHSVGWEIMNDEL